MTTTYTHEEIAHHNVPTFPLSHPVRGWKVDDKGFPGAEVTIPAGARAVNLYAEICRALLARYGNDRSVGDFILPDGSLVGLFFKLSDAARALPQECPAWEWDVPSQMYRPPSP